MKRIVGAAAGAAMILGMAGCESVTLPASGRSEMEVGVRGDGGSNGYSAYQAGSSSDASGRIEIEARVYLQAATGEWVEVTEGVARQSVDASGGDGVRVLASGSVEASSYARVRVEFERVTTQVDGQLTVAAGALTGTVRVDGGSDGRVTLEREIRLDARADAVSRLEIDLNADQWLARADASTGAVAESEFASAVNIIAT